MNNITIENKGTITLGEKVMVSDPCYGLGTWCQGVLDNVLPGVYDCNVEYSDEGDWGIRVSAIEVTHESCRGRFIALECEDFDVGVDSGQAGIFDYEYYAKYHMDATERPHVDDDWYDMVCDLTYTHTPNPDYEKFHWENTDDSTLDAYEEYDLSVDDGEIPLRLKKNKKKTDKKAQKKRRKKASARARRRAASRRKTFSFKPLTHREQ